VDINLFGTSPPRAKNSDLFTNFSRFFEWDARCCAADLGVQPAPSVYTIGTRLWFYDDFYTYKRDNSQLCYCRPK
jgi:hypothetical protein